MKRLIWDELWAWKEQISRKPLLLMGARQVGKTYILKEFGKNAFQAVHYFNFEQHLLLGKIFEEDLAPKKILSKLSFYLNQRIDITHD